MTRAFRASAATAADRIRVVLTQEIAKL